MSPADRYQALAYRILAVGVLLAALLLRCLAISRFSLGNDEIQEIRFSRLPWHEFLPALQADAGHPPLEFSVQAVISRTAAAEWVHRVPSVLAGVGTVALAMFLARRWFGRLASLVAGILLACSPIHVRYSQEVRPYALALFLLVASVAALEQYRRRPRRSLALLWFFSTLGAAYTLYFAGMISALVGILFVFQHRKAELKPLWRALPACIAGWAFLYLPWLPTAVSIARRMPVADPEALNRAWLTYRLQTLATGDWRVEPLSVGSYVFWALVAVGLAQAFHSRAAILTSAWLVLGGISQVLFLQLKPHFPAVRYLLPSWLASVLLAGYAVQLAGRRRTLLALGLAGVCVILIADLRTLRAYYDHGRPEWNTVAGYLARHARPGERIAAANGWVFRNLGFYWVDERLGRVDVPLERAWGTVSGPAWIVTAVCPMSADVRRQVEALGRMAAFPMTNECEIRYLAGGGKLSAPSGMCLSDP